ncbi:MAG: substrate-binding domain-containing protein [Candidatus Dormibacteraeota bacterium]|nr:substrate-binding domain-containing protein [Candidatus Dormibacteraeota bacterium]
MRFGRIATVLAVVAAITASACGGSSGSSGSSSGGGAKKIALLLPESKTARYESKDRPLFEAKVKSLCSDCQVLYSNANQDAAAQQSQADAALTNGANVLVLDAVDGKAAAAIAQKAKQQKVPVVSYDRLIQNTSGVDVYISFDNHKVGQLQGQALLQALAGKPDPTVVMINGSPTDANAAQFKAGAHSVLDGKVKIAKEYDTPDWSPDQAQNEAQQALTALGNKVDGIYAANDGTAGGAIAAMKAAGVKAPFPPVTGQDAELAGIQRVVAGEQYMTVYKAIKPEAEGAAELAVSLAQGKGLPSGMAKSKQNNGTTDVPSELLTPVAVTKQNVNDTVVKDGFWPKDQICTAQYADACKAAGL